MLKYLSYPILFRYPIILQLMSTLWNSCFFLSLPPLDPSQRLLGQKHNYSRAKGLQEKVVTIGVAINSLGMTPAVSSGA